MRTAMLHAVQDDQPRTAGPPTPSPGLRTEADLRAAYRAHGAEIHRLALRGLGDPHLAEEVTQDVFVQAWRSRDGFDPSRAALRTWLFVIARTRTIDAARRRAARPPVAGGSPGPDPLDLPVARLQQALELEEALRQLPEPQRHALVQVHLLGRTSQQVADELGVAAATVRSRIFHGLKALRATIAAPEVDPA